MRAVVTGGAGFIGSHLCDALMRKGHEVVCLDNLITGRPANVAHLMGEKGFRFVHYDVTDFLYIEGPLDAVLHFASPASPADYLRLPIQTLKVGSLGTHKTLGLAREKRATFLLASTSEVYGDPQIHPQPETYWGHVNPIGARGVYDEAKRFAEAMTMAYHRVHNVDTRIVRLFNCFGPRMRLDDGRALPNFMRQALRGEDITIYGDGEQTRSFTYVDDTVDGILRLLESSEPMPVNVGNPQEISIRQLAEEIVELTGSASRLVLQPFPPGFEDDPKVRQPDITRARQILDWEPRTPRRAGLEMTLDYFKAELAL